MFKYEEQFWDFVNERRRIWVRRHVEKRSWPWTEDEILQTYHFTEVFRELDRVTKELHRRVDAKPLINDPKADRMYRIIVFRAFNLPETYDRIHAQHAEHNIARMKRILHKAKHEGHKIFTGAFVISNGASTRPKIDVICDSLTTIRKERADIWQQIEDANSMQFATELLATYPMMGMFNSFEVVCDLRHQRGMLDRATDIMTWANPGPGARRGINYIVSGRSKPNVFRGTEEYVKAMNELLARAPKHLDKKAFKGAPPFEMREVEHQNCEFAKYRNAQTGERRLKRKYHP